MGETEYSLKKVMKRIACCIEWKKQIQQFLGAFRNALAELDEITP